MAQLVPPMVTDVGKSQRIVASVVNSLVQKVTMVKITNTNLGQTLMLYSHLIVVSIQLRYILILIMVLYPVRPKKELNIIFELFSFQLVKNGQWKVILYHIGYVLHDIVGSYTIAMHFQATMVNNRKQYFWLFSLVICMEFFI